eukprot:TRINITY_DN3796_c0_g1_i4.p1 TRINITY_DN3796_c0_g1~~TRINITY_DN3796_c0_g1_i4.p1  ORF type:complete len:398 (+),score=65.99 TRINITY_DN3796_c0_g1_i4:455-1648(+)
MEAKSWENIATIGNVPVARHCHAVAVHEDKMYIFGGYSDDTERRGTQRNDLCRFSFESSKWDMLYVSKENKPISRHSHSMVSFEGNLFVFGGIGPAGQMLNDIHKYNIEQGKWSEVSAVGGSPPERWGHTANLLTREDGETSMIIFGGYGRNFLRDIWEFKFSDLTWRQLPAFGHMPNSRQFHGAAIYKNWLYIVGGLGASENHGDCFKFNFDSHVWVRVNNLSGRRRGHVTVVHNNILYIHGGFNKTQRNDVNYMDMDDPNPVWITIQDYETSNTPSARHFHSAVVYKLCMYIFGGYSQKQSNLNDVHRFFFEEQPILNLNPSRSLSRDMRMMVNNQQFSDITFVVGGQRVFAHKNILSCRSEHFCALISNSMKESFMEAIEMVDVDFQVFLRIRW